MHRKLLQLTLILHPAPDSTARYEISEICNDLPPKCIQMQVIPQCYYSIFNAITHHKKLAQKTTVNTLPTILQRITVECMDRAKPPPVLFLKALRFASPRASSCGPRRCSASRRWRGSGARLERERATGPKPKEKGHSRARLDEL